MKKQHCFDGGVTTASVNNAKLIKNTCEKLALMTSYEWRHIYLWRYFPNKVPRPGDSKGTFSVIESSCHMLLPG